MNSTLPHWQLPSSFLLFFVSIYSTNTARIKSVSCTRDFISMAGAYIGILVKWSSIRENSIVLSSAKRDLYY